MNQASPEKYQAVSRKYQASPAKYPTVSNEV